MIESHIARQSIAGRWLHAYYRIHFLISIYFKTLSEWGHRKRRIYNRHRRSWICSEFQIRLYVAAPFWNYSVYEVKFRPNFELFVPYVNVGNYGREMSQSTGGYRQRFLCVFRISNVTLFQNQSVSKRLGSKIEAKFRNFWPCKNFGEWCGRL